MLPAETKAAELDLLRERVWRKIPTWETRESILKRTEDQPIITDDNMVNEWRSLTIYPETSE